MLAMLAGCYGLSVCDPLKFRCWNTLSDVILLGGGDFRKGLGHEGGDLMNRISILIKETPRAS